jgi:hypothetical protein
MTADYLFTFGNANQPLRLLGIPGNFDTIGKHRFLLRAAISGALYARNALKEMLRKLERG